MQQLDGAARQAPGNRHYCRHERPRRRDPSRAAGECSRTRARATAGISPATALGAVLARAGIEVDGQRLAYLMMDAELDHVICSGPRQGKQFTYALARRTGTACARLTVDEALAELTRRYFTSHGPATVRDFVWWSGLTVKQAKTGLDDARPRPSSRRAVDGMTYWSMPSARRSASTLAGPIVSPAAELRRVSERASRSQPGARSRGTAVTVGAFVGFPHQLAIDGILRGAWKRETTSRQTRIIVQPFRPLNKTRSTGAERAAVRV